MAQSSVWRFPLSLFLSLSLFAVRSFYSRAFLSPFAYIIDPGLFNRTQFPELFSPGTRHARRTRNWPARTEIMFPSFGERKPRVLHDSINRDRTATNYESISCLLHTHLRASALPAGPRTFKNESADRPVFPRFFRAILPKLTRSHGDKRNEGIRNRDCVLRSATFSTCTIWTLTARAIKDEGAVKSFESLGRISCSRVFYWHLTDKTWVFCNWYLKLKHNIHREIFFFFMSNIIILYRVNQTKIYKIYKNI